MTVVIILQLKYLVICIFCQRVIWYLKSGKINGASCFNLYLQFPDAANAKRAILDVLGSAELPTFMGKAPDLVAKLLKRFDLLCLMVLS